MTTQAGCAGSVLDARPEFIKRSGVLSDMKMLTQPKTSDGKYMLSSTLALSPDGKYLAATAKNMEYVVVWDVENEKVIKKIPSKPNRLTGARLIFSPNGKYLAASMFISQKDPLKNYVRIRSSGKSIEIQNKPEEEESERADEPLKNHPVVAIFSTADFELERRVGSQPGPSHLFTFSPDSRYLLIDGYSVPKALDLIETRTWESVRQVNDVPRAVDLEFTPDGKNIFYLFVDRNNYELIKIEGLERPGKRYHTDLHILDAKTLKVSKTINRLIDGVDGLNQSGYFSVHPETGYFTCIGLKFVSDWEIRGGERGYIDILQVKDLWNNTTVLEKEIFTFGSEFERYTSDGKYFIRIGDDNKKRTNRSDIIQLYSTDGKLLEYLKIKSAPFVHSGALSANSKVLAKSWAHRVFLWRINSVAAEEN